MEWIDGHLEEWATGAPIWVALLLLAEIVWSRRLWCRYVCPVGLGYGLAGVASPLPSASQ